MPIFIDPTGRGTFGIGICGRCSRKFSIEELHPDPNSPGLMVCIDDLDDLDPYRLPPRQPDDITLPFTRPDVPLDGTELNPGTLLLYEIITEDGDPMISETGDELVLEVFEE